MYQVVLLDKDGLEVKEIETKSFLLSVNQFEEWLKQDAFDGETLLLWDNDNLVKELNVRKKSDFRHGESMFGIVDGFTEVYFKKDIRKWQKKKALNC